MKKRGVSVLREDNLDYQLKYNQLEIKLQMIKNAVVMISVLYLVALLLIPPYVFNKNYYEHYYVEQSYENDERFVEQIPTFSDMPAFNNLITEISLKDITIFSCKKDVSTNDYYLTVNVNDEPLPAILKIKDTNTKPYIHGELFLLPIPEDIMKNRKSVVYKIRLTTEEFEGFELVCNG